MQKIDKAWLYRSFDYPIPKPEKSAKISGKQDCVVICIQFFLIKGSFWGFNPFFLLLLDAFWRGGGLMAKV